ncbi:hypothetical protein G7Y79_00013g035870 [Physcia stellaris]|nr:hypothetical protein G7Y79_00013g035870 [Physcia stellaris]
MGSLLSRPPSSPPPHTPSEELSTILFTASSRLFFSIRRTKSFQKKLHSNYQKLDSPTAVQTLVYHKLKHGAEVLLERQCAQREWIETQREWLRGWIAERRFEHHMRELWKRKHELLEREARGGKRVWEHVREGAEICDGVEGKDGRQRGTYAVPSVVEKESDQAIEDSLAPVKQNMDQGFERKDDEETDVTAGWYSASVGEEAIIDDDAEEASVWHDGAGGDLGDHWSATSAAAAAGAFEDWDSMSAAPTSKQECEEESWALKPDLQPQEVGAWANGGMVSAASPDAWISGPDSQQQNAGIWDDNSTVIPTVVDTWGWKPEQLHKVGTWDDSGTPDKAIVEEHERSEWCCVCWHCTQNRRCKNYDSNLKEGLWNDGVNVNGSILENSTTWVAAKEEEDTGKDKPCTCWDCDGGSGCWVHGSGQQEWTFKENTTWDEVASVNNTIVTTNDAESYSWSSQTDRGNDWISTAKDWSSTENDWGHTTSDESATASDWSSNIGTEQLDRASVDSIGWDEAATDEVAADSWRCTDSSWSWSKWTEGLSGCSMPCSPNLMTWACDDSSWYFKCKQHMANAWSDIDETESAVEAPCIREQDTDAEVDEAFMSTADVKEADYSCLTNTEEENAAGNDLFSGERANDLSDDESLWIEVGDCDTSIHRDPSVKEGWDTESDFEVSDCDTVIHRDQNGEETWDIGSDYEGLGRSLVWIGDEWDSQQGSRQSR